MYEVYGVVFGAWRVALYVVRGGRWLLGAGGRRASGAVGWWGRPCLLDKSPLLLHLLRGARVVERGLDRCGTLRLDLLRLAPLALRLLRCALRSQRVELGLLVLHLLLHRAQPRRLALLLLLDALLFLRVLLLSDLAVSQVGGDAPVLVLALLLLALRARGA